MLLTNTIWASLQGGGFKNKKSRQPPGLTGFFKADQMFKCFV